MKNSDAGFTIVEILVTIGFIGIAAAGISSLLISVQTVQRNATSVDTATRAAQREIETLRSSTYSALTPGQTINFTSQLPTILRNQTGTAVVSEPSTDIRRIDATVSYRVNGVQRKVTLSSLIGTIGLTK